MANTLISKILDTVKKADAIVDKANDDKKEIIDLAINESDKKALEIVDKAKKDAERLIEDNRLKARDLSDKRVEEAKEKIKNLNIGSLDKKDVNRAIDYIVKKVVRDGNS